MTHLYLSHLMLEPRSRQVQRETTDFYQLHRTIMNAFDDRREAAGVLYRINAQRGSNDLSLLVQSTTVPDWRWLAEGNYLLEADPFAGGQNPVVKEMNLNLPEGRLLRFRLRANPTIKKKRDGQLSNRVPLVRDEQQEKWLFRKADQHGFRLVRFDISGQKNRQGWKRTNEKRQKLTLYEVQYDGVLQVTDPISLQMAVAQGVGPAKAFGCGLLSLAPA